MRKWIESFLSDRLQRVVADGHMSSAIGVISGVPNGSVLGPILVLLFIKDTGDGSPMQSSPLQKEQL